MSDVLTIDEINRRYPDEWVLVGDPELDDERRVVRGQVLCHSRNRDEVYREATQTSCKHLATLYLGTIPEGTIPIL